MNAGGGGDLGRPVGGRQEIPLVLIVAVADNGVIGRAGAMPWRLKSDLRHFRAVTMGKPVIMGRKTYLSIGKPLPGRTNIVVSRDLAFTAAGVLVAPNLEAALCAARGDALRRSAEDIAIIGGADIYAQTMPGADRLVLTRVHLQPDGDTTFPAVDPGVWQEIERTEYRAGPDDAAPFTVLVYQRVVASDRAARGDE